MSYYLSMPFTLRLFGSPAIQLEDGSWQDIANTKPALLLLYLAFVGDWVSRGSLATLLQPDGDDENVRRYLRVLLNRTKDFSWTGALEIESKRLKFALCTDVQQFQAAIAAEQWAVAYELHKKSLLEGFVIREAPALDAWLELERDRLLRAWNLSALRHAQNLSENRNHTEAMRVLEQLLQHDPLQEDVVVAFMRQCARTGSKLEAIRAFERFRTALELELGLEPMPETLVLLERIRRSEEVVVNAPAAKSQPIAKVLLRPPRLIGRAPEMAMFQNSSAKINLFLAEAGAGKTRLLEEIAPARARWWYCREGLEGVPYQPITQWLRANLNTIPELGAYREDLARLVPEIAPNETFGPGEPSSAKARLLEALARVFEANQNPIVIDDLQWVDSSSLETLTVIASRGRVPIVAAVRSDEINTALEETLNTWRGQGIILEIKLEPLRPESLQTLIEDVSDNEAINQNISQWLSENAGGNAFFVLETLRDLIENGAVIDLNNLRIPNQVQHLIERRFKRLSETTQRVLQAASVMREGFTPQYLSGMIGISEFAALDALEETERAGFINGNRFQHDLVRQSMYKNIQETRRKILHARAATLLEETSDDIEIAEHWSNAGNKENAVTFWVKAAKYFEAKHDLQNAVLYFKKASQITENLALGQDYLLWAIYHAIDINSHQEFTLSLQEIIDNASNDEIYWFAYTQLARIKWMIDGNFDEAEKILNKIEQAFPNLEFPNERLTNAFFGVYIDVLQYQGNSERALEFLRRESEDFVFDAAHQCMHKNSVAISLLGLQRLDEARTELEAAIELAEQANSINHHLHTAVNWLSLNVRANTPEIAVDYATSTLQKDLEGTFFATEVLRNNLSACLARLNRKLEAVQLLEYNTQHATLTYQGLAWGRLATLYFESNQHDKVSNAVIQVVDIAEKISVGVVQIAALIPALKFGTVQDVKRARATAMYTQDLLNANPYLIPQLEEAEQIWAKRQLEMD
jgi:DNA-binding SARP family transcriptional activator